MILVTSDEPLTCVAASLAMVLDVPYWTIRYDLFKDLEFPFEPPYDKYPKVPSMAVIVDYAYREHNNLLIPFERNPVCAPHENCKPVPVWEDGESKFKSQLFYGSGLIECIRQDGIGHMVAWDRHNIFDPQGYIYSYELMSAYHLEAQRFWLCI